MRSHNKARLIDIADKGLDPNVPYHIGVDGRLSSDLHDSQTEQSISETLKETEVEEPVSKVENVSSVIFAAASQQLQSEKEENSSLNNLQKKKNTKTKK